MGLRTSDQHGPPTSRSGISCGQLGGVSVDRSGVPASGRRPSEGECCAMADGGTDASTRASRKKSTEHP